MRTTLENIIFGKLKLKTNKTFIKGRKKNRNSKNEDNIGEYNIW
jgi:hypothetical protein